MSYSLTPNIDNLSDSFFFSNFSKLQFFSCFLSWKDLRRVGVVIWRVVTSSWVSFSILAAKGTMGGCSLCLFVSCRWTNSGKYDVEEKSLEASGSQSDCSWLLTAYISKTICKYQILAPNLYPNELGSLHPFLIIIIQMQPGKNMQLARENKKLRAQLRDANITIRRLQQEISALQDKLSRYQNEESTYNHISPTSSDQIFTESSEQSIEQPQSMLYTSERLTKEQLPYEYQTQSVLKKPISIGGESLTPPKVIFNYQEEGNQAPRVLSRHSKKKLTGLETTPITVKNYGRVNDQDQSAIKIQEPISVKTPNEIMQRVVSNSKKIYDCFFVTGYSFQYLRPKVQYFFPERSKHFDAILNLIYNENTLRIYESLSATRSPKFSNSPRGKLDLKETFIIPLCNSHEQQREYLVACEVEDFIEGQDGLLYTFSRMFCFITRCTFFSELRKILIQFIDKLNKTKSPLLKYSPLPPSDCKGFLGQSLCEHLRILYGKNVQKNQYVNIGLGDQINIFIDVLPEEREYEYLLGYQEWKILGVSVFLANEEDYVGSNENHQLIGFLLAYIVTQTKLLLYSSMKSKISEAILHALEIIKPLQYVNPIIMAAIKDEHQEYFGAPMPVLLGLWGQTKRKKQKIQIFMNKKTNFAGMVEEGKIQLEDGVVFNLDTGYVFGGGLNPTANQLATELNSLISKQCKNVKQQYRIFNRLIQGKLVYESAEVRSVSQMLLNCIRDTQLYSFYRDKADSVIKK